MNRVEHVAGARENRGALAEAPHRLWRAWMGNYVTQRAFAHRRLFTTMLPSIINLRMADSQPRSGTPTAP
jgi:hypothetical protein